MNRKNEWMTRGEKSMSVGAGVQADTRCADASAARYSNMRITTVHLFQGADGAIMLADDTREASATGFMKAQMNGGAILATADGAVPEFVYFQGIEPSEKRVNGFYIPYINGEPTALGLLEALEAFDKAMSNPASAASIIRSALAVTPHVGVDRTVDDMKKLYETLLK